MRALCVLLLLTALPAQQFAVGSKKFTESVILGELLTLLARDAGANVRHEAQLGGTRILWNALLAGEIDIYPEYTGTIVKEIFSFPGGRRFEFTDPSGNHLAVWTDRGLE